MEQNKIVTYYVIKDLAHGQHTVVSRVYANVMNMRKKQCSSFGIMHSGRPS